MNVSLNELYREFEHRITQAVKSLLESKHLYQTVTLAYEDYNVPQKLDHPISLEEGHWGERNDDDVTAAAQWRV